MTQQSISTYDRVVELLNQAALSSKDEEKLKNLKIIEELIVNKEQNLLDNFLDEMLAFQTDRSIEVKKYVIHFMAVAGKADVELLPRIVGNMSMMLSEENVNVVKILVLNLSHVFKAAFKWLATSRVVTENMKKTWNQAMYVLAAVSEFIDSENEGLRSNAIKFLEVIVITLSRPPEDPEIIRPSNNKGPTYLDDINLTLIPPGHPVLKSDRLEDEGRKSFDKLMTYQSSTHISSINLITTMSSMTTISKLRPCFLGQVVQGFESLHVNLPPTLTKSQVSSVRKHLKMQLLAILRLPAAIDYQSNIAILLTDLGATQSEVMKNMPRPDNGRKRKLEDNAVNPKKAKTEQVSVPEPMNVGGDDEFSLVRSANQTKPQHQSAAELQTNATSSTSSAVDARASAPPPLESSRFQSAIDVTAEDLVPKLTPENVTDLVLISMVDVPEQMPSSFQSTYTPIAAAGTPVQIRHLARLLSAQLTNAKIGKGYEMMEAQRNVEKGKKEQSGKSKEAGDFKFEEEEDEDSKHRLDEGQMIETVVGGAIVNNDDAVKEDKEEKEEEYLPLATSVQPTRKSMTQFKLDRVTKPLGKQERADLTNMKIRRFLGTKHLGCVGNIKWKVAVTIGTKSDKIGEDFFQHVFSDLRNRSDLIFNLIYQEYSNYKMASKLNGRTSTQESKQTEREMLQKYEDCVTTILRALLDRPDQKDGAFFNHIILLAPELTPSIAQVLKESCLDDSRIYLGMTTLKELILKRPRLKEEFLDMLLQFTTHDKSEVRQNAIRVVKTLHEISDLQEKIESHAMALMKHLLRPTPPNEVVKVVDEGCIWTDDTIRVCLYLYLALLPARHQLIHELASVYTNSSSDIKRVILRVIETPVKGMGMESPELLLLVENCPKGAETLVTRVIHILTDRVIPSPELVNKVRDLYQRRVSDVRFLIPVLNGLTKAEVIAALPKLIKLNPVVVKEVFNRLLGVNGQECRPSSLSPTELLTTLHTLDPAKADMKAIIKACSLCFAEKSVYTQEVLAIVMQQLMDITPLPTLLMRTVIQSLATYPKLSGFVLNILQRLIAKQVWRNKRVWEGFVKCCQRTKPQSFQVLLQLPPTQLRDAFLLCPDLREPLLSHVISLTPHQRAHIPKAIMSVLEKPPSGSLHGMPEQVKPKPNEGEDRVSAQNSPGANVIRPAEYNDHTEGFEAEGVSGEESEEGPANQDLPH